MTSDVQPLPHGWREANGGFETLGQGGKSVRVIARPAGNPTKAVGGMVFEKGDNGPGWLKSLGWDAAPHNLVLLHAREKVREALSNNKVPRRVQQQGQIVRGIVQRAKQKGKGRASDQDLKIRYATVCKEVKQLQSEIDKGFKQYRRLGGHTDGYFRALHLPSLKPLQRQLEQRAINGVKETPTVQAHALVIGLERLKKRAVSPSAEQSAAKRALGASSRAVSKIATRAGRPRSRERTLYNIVLADLAGSPQTTTLATSLRDDGHTVRVVSDRKHSMATNCAYAVQRAA